MSAGTVHGRQLSKYRAYPGPDAKEPVCRTHRSGVWLQVLNSAQLMKGTFFEHEV